MSQPREKEHDLSKMSDAPTDTQGGAMPGSSESSNTQNAYPRPDASVGKLPAAIAGSVEDPTGDRNRQQLLALAQDQGIDGAGSMNRAALAEALKGSMSPESLLDACADQRAQLS